MEQPNLLRRTFERIRPRMSPSLLVIGAQKAGTSALFRMLAQHPKSMPPRQKEIDFFNVDPAYAKGMGYYRSLFPAVPAKSFGHFTFEASPSYLYFADRCAPRIAKDLPGVICVAILRDPVKRAFSAWNMRRDFKTSPKWAHLHDPRSFVQAVEDELTGRTTDLLKCYLARGYYARQLAFYMKAIGSDRLSIHSYGDFKQHPGRVMNRILHTMRLDPMPEEHDAFKLKANVRAYMEPLDQGLSEELYRHFEPHREELNALLGYEINLSE